MAANERKSQEELTSNLRQAVNNAYGFIKGMESIQSFYAVTFEEMVQRQMDRLTGENMGARDSEENRIKKVGEDLRGAIQAIKSIPQDRLYRSEDNDDKGVNPSKSSGTRTA